MADRMRIFFDGGCRPNPGMMETALVFRGQTYITRDIGQGSSTQAEWHALIAALRLARAVGAADFVLTGDSATVVNQARGIWPCRDPLLRAHFDTFRALAGADSVTVRWIKRSQNLAGIALAALHDG